MNPKTLVLCNIFICLALVYVFQEITMTGKHADGHACRLSICTDSICVLMLHATHDDHDDYAQIPIRLCFVEEVEQSHSVML